MTWLIIITIKTPYVVQANGAVMIAGNIPPSRECFPKTSSIRQDFRRDSERKPSLALALIWRGTEKHQANDN